MSAPNPATEAVERVRKVADRYRSAMSDNGHCGEGTLERNARSAEADTAGKAFWETFDAPTIIALLTALQKAEKKLASAHEGSGKLQDLLHASQARAQKAEADADSWKSDAAIEFLKRQKAEEEREDALKMCESASAELLMQADRATKLEAALGRAREKIPQTIRWAATRAIGRPAMSIEDVIAHATKDALGLLSLAEEAR